MNGVEREAREIEVDQEERELADPLIVPPYDPQALIFEGNEYAALGFLQGALLHLLVDAPYSIDRYRAALILQRAEREVMSEATQKRSLILIGLSEATL